MLSLQGIIVVSLWQAGYFSPLKRNVQAGQTERCKVRAQQQASGCAAPLPLFSFLLDSLLEMKFEVSQQRWGTAYSIARLLKCRHCV